MIRAKSQELNSHRASQLRPVEVLVDRRRARLVEGRLQLDTWEDNGKKRSKLRVVGERMQILGAPKGDSKVQPPEPVVVEEDIPF